MTTDYTTYDDLVQHLAMRYELTLSGVSLAHALVGSREAYRRLFSMHDWNYFRRFELIKVLAPYSTGTIEYTHSTRTVTLTGGTWPAAARFGDLEIAQVNYMVEYRASDTTLVLPENHNPGADIASGTSYQWVQRRYPMSFDVGDIYDVMESNHTAPMNQVDIRDAFWLTESYISQTFPRRYVVVPSQHLPGRWEVWFPQAVYENRDVSILYTARHRPLSVQHLDGIDLDVTGAAATFPSGKLKAEHVGCVVRISSDDHTPTSRVGRLDDTNQDWSHHPFESERVIVAVSGDTAVLSEPLENDVTERAWSISQLCDIDAGSMTTFLLRLCESEYTKVAGLDNSSLQNAETLVQQHLIDAGTDDGRAITPRASYSSGPLRLEDIGEVVW